MTGAPNGETIYEGPVPDGGGDVVFPVPDSRAVRVTVDGGGNLRIEALDKQNEDD